MGEPSVRARHLKATLTRVELAPEARAILGALPAGYATRVQESYGGDWLPVELDVVLARAIRDHLSPAQHHDFCVNAVAASFQGPLLGTLVHVASGILGKDVRRVAAWVPKGWALLFRDVGAWTVEPHPSAPEVRLTLSGLPAVCTAEESWVRACAASLSAVCPLAGVTGRVTLEGLDRPQGRAEFLLRWTP